MDRLTQLRGGGAGGSQDTSLDGSSPGDSFLTANDSSKYFSVSEDDSFEITKDETLAATSSQNSLSEDLISNLSPIGKDILDYKIGKQIEAANILSGGVAIFEDNDNSYDGNELVIDDNIESDDKSQSPNSQEGSELFVQNVDDNLGERNHIEGLRDSKETIGDDNLDQSRHIEDIEESKVTVGEDNLGESSHIEDMEEINVTAGDENLGDSSHIEDTEESKLIVDEENMGESSNIEDVGESKETVGDENSVESSHIEDMRESRETEVMLQIDGNNVDAINIGNGLYLYRKEGQRELEAVQIVDDDQQQPTFKFLKVRDNAEGNLEVYEEIEVEVTGEVPDVEGILHALPQTPEHLPIKDIAELGCSKIVEMNTSTPDKEVDTESSKDVPPESKTELNSNSKTVKYSESRKSPLMAYHSTPNKEGIPLTKTMVDQQLHPSRHSDNIKKTIEVHTDSCKQRMFDTPITINKGTATSENTPDEAIEEDKFENKEVLCSEETSKIGKDKVQDDFDNKSIQVTDIPYNDEKDEKKIKDSVMEDLKRIGVMSSLSSFNKDSTNKETKLNEVVENPPKNPGSSKTVKFKDENPKIGPQALNEIQSKLVEKDPTIEQVLMKRKVTDVAIPENKESNENEIISTEIVYLEEKEDDEDAVVIEEVVNEVSQIEEPDFKVQDERKLVPSAEVKTVVGEDQIHTHKKEEVTRDISKKRESSEELKATLVADEEIVIEFTDENKERQNCQPSEGTIAVDNANEIQNLVENYNSKRPITKNVVKKPEINKSGKEETKLPNPRDLTRSPEINKSGKEETKLPNPRDLTRSPEINKSGKEETKLPNPRDLTRSPEINKSGKEETKIPNPRDLTRSPEINKSGKEETKLPNPRDLTRSPEINKSGKEETKLPNPRDLTRSPEINKSGKEETKIPNPRDLTRSPEMNKSGKEDTKLPNPRDLTWSPQINKSGKEETKIPNPRDLTRSPEINKSGKDETKLPNPRDLTRSPEINKSGKEETKLPNPRDRTRSPEINKSGKEETKIPNPRDLTRSLEINKSGKEETKLPNPRDLTRSPEINKSGKEETKIPNPRDRTRSPEINKSGKEETKLPNPRDLTRSPKINKSGKVETKIPNPRDLTRSLEINKSGKEETKLPNPRDLTRSPEINKSGKEETKLPNPSDLTRSLEAFEKSGTKSKCCSKNESEVTKTDETKLQNNIETVTLEMIKPQINKRNENISDSQTDKDSTQSKAAAPDNLVKVQPTFGNTSHIPDKNLALLAKDTKDIAASTDQANKELNQINPQKNTEGDKLNNANENPIIVKAAELKTNCESEPVKQGAVDIEPKSINNNHAPVPFGKWTDIHRIDFLNQFKLSKVSVSSCNTSQLKQPFDLNRRDVLMKIAKQRQTYNASIRTQEYVQRASVATEMAFASKSMVNESKVPSIGEATAVEQEPTLIINPVLETVQKVQPETSAAISNTTKEESRRKEINNQHLIDKTIEGIINRAVSVKSPEDAQHTVIDKISEKNDKQLETPVNDQPALLDAIEIKMNELHGIPFVERPPHELPWPYSDQVSSIADSQPLQQKLSKIPNLLPLPKPQQKPKDFEVDVTTLESAKHNSMVLHSVPKAAEKLSSEPVPKSDNGNKMSTDKVITEKEFDKFARRNSITYENCLAVTDEHQVIQTVAPKEMPPKKISRNEQMLAEAKAKSPHKPQPMRQYHPSKGAIKYTAVAEAQTKQYQTKLQMAYQTALTAKRKMDSPITIIEEKPVKVMYLDSGTEFTATQLNAQGRELSPARRAEPDALTIGTNDSLDSDILDAIEDVKSLEETKTKSKHQRKQVLTPVETPDLELIEPGDLGIEVSPKKKRKIDEKSERSIKNLAPKKSYLLGRSSVRPEAASDPQTKVSPRAETVQPNPVPPLVHMDTVSAIDNLVKAAEMLENQSECLSANTSIRNIDSPQDTPMKRGRGRPRKYPLPEGSPNAAPVKVHSPPKRPRLLDSENDELSCSDENTSDDEAMIKENWTMGKINENIVCPICSKLFRSENVVFKHVKHCTGPSPSRSDSDKCSPRRRRLSNESEAKSRETETTSRDSYTKWTENEPESRHSRHDDVDYPPPTTHTPRKRKSKDSACKSTSSNDDVIPVDTNAKESHKVEEAKKETRKHAQTKFIPKSSNLVCEICGKSFRQLSYLVSHKLQHKKDDCKKSVEEAQSTEKSVFSCEKCKKEFRKLHHLVQHRLIHNPVPLRKTSSEQKELPKSEESPKAEDQSAGFRCEPCDKSFRKLHHLVEHRETHDGINRQRSNSVTQVNPEKSTAPPQCEICGKSFRKLHHLMEHKEQHLETSSEKSDDQKSVKSSLSTKDIIHECNLCYMVFPNEHSLTKHTVICLRKKRQSATKQALTEDKDGEDSAKSIIPEESEVKIITEQQIMETVLVDQKKTNVSKSLNTPPAKLEVPQQKDKPLNNDLVQTADNSDKHLIEPKELPKSKDAPTLQSPIPKATNKTADVPAKIKQIDEIIVIEDTPKKKVVIKGKVASVTKRQKVVASNTVAEERRAVVASSDDDEVRYMFNPDFRMDETAEGKNFMKVRAKKRSSFQIERTNSKDLVRRKSLLQQPPKIPRLKAKSDDVKIAPTNQLPKHQVKPKLEKEEPVPSTDSDDSDVKYSFPKNISQKPAQAAKKESAGIDKKRRKTMTEKRKSLSVIAKRKSLGKAIVKPQPSPAKPIKRRTAAEHRCDCGQLFGSAALLSRHASLAHTPPRVRRRREPPAAPAQPNKPSEKNTPKLAAKKDQNAGPVRKSNTKSDKTDARKSVSETVQKNAKSRNRVHGGVPVPEKRARK